MRRHRRGSHGTLKEKYVDDGSRIAGRVCDDEAEEAVEGLAEDDA